MYKYLVSARVYGLRSVPGAVVVSPFYAVAAFVQGRRASVEVSSCYIHTNTATRSPQKHITYTLLVSMIATFFKSFRRLYVSGSVARLVCLKNTC